MRATRDLLRRRNHLLPTPAELDVHLQHTASQSNLSESWGRLAKPQNCRGLIERCDHSSVQQHMAVDTARIDWYDPLLAELERSIEKTAHSHEPVSLALMHTMPGVGTSLALVMRSKLEEIARFPQGQDCVSSCRLVKSAKESHGTRYGTSGKKLGNAHRQWAFVEAAVLLRKHSEPAQQYLTKLANRHGKGKVLSSLSHTLGRAVYGMLNKQVAFDQAKFLATEGWRERTSLASHGSHRGKRHHYLRIAPSEHARGP
jgi:transposase